MNFVAEVWLEWPICRGATMFRATARTQARALVKAKLRAKLLDLVLPKTYPGEDWSGRPVRYSYDFGILYGVRKPTAQEQEVGVVPIWTTVLPGYKGHAGENARSHPVVGDLALLAGEGLKI
jgi:hypothetical protein